LEIYQEIELFDLAVPRPSWMHWKEKISMKIEKDNWRIFSLINSLNYQL